MWSGPFDLEDAVSLETVEAEAKTPALDERLLPVEVGLAELPELACTPEGAVRLGNGNAGMVRVSDLSYGEEAWASYEGRPVAVGQYRAGDLHPSRGFNLN
jgi:tRNA pseudouridine55 synthase